MTPSLLPPAPPAPRSGLYVDDYPAGHSGWATASDGQRIRYEVHGQGDLAFVFIHGGMCDRTYWAAQVEWLSRSYRVVTLDLPGHGESDKGRSHWRIEDFGDDVVQVVNAVGAAKSIVVGHSMGGLVALEAAHLLGGGAAGVVLVDILHEPNGPAGAAPVLPQDAAAYRAALAAGLQRGMFAAACDTAHRSRIVAALVNFPRGIAEPLRAASGAYDAAAALQRIATLPLTMMLSDLRTTNPGAIWQLHPASRICVFRGAGHFLMIERPQDFNSVLLTQSLMMDGSLHCL